MTFDLEDFRRRYAADSFAAGGLGAQIDEVDEGYALCSMALDEKRHFNASGFVMGGVAFTLADFAFAVATDAVKTGTVSLSSQITYLSRVRGKRLIAEARCQKSGRHTCYYTVSVSDDTDTRIAEVTITGYIR